MDLHANLEQMKSNLQTMRSRRNNAGSMVRTVEKMVHNIMASSSASVAKEK